MSPGDDAAVLEQRARALAQVIEDDDNTDLLSVVTFTVGDRRFGVEAGYVREVLRQVEVSGVPWAPPALLGVANVRGEILAVADLGRLLGPPTPPVPGPLVILDGPTLPLGLLVQRVEDLLTLPADAVGKPPDDEGGSIQALLLGVSADAVILDASALLEDPRLSAAENRRPDAAQHH